MEYINLNHEKYLVMKNVKEGLDIEEPKNYYENEEPKDTWKQNGDIFYSNWINYYLDK